MKQKGSEFQLKLQNCFEDLKIEEVEEMALNIINTIRECALKTAGKGERRRDEKLKAETKGLLKDRREVAKKDLSA